MDYASFPGPIVQSTNCLIEPRPSYKGRLFTTNSTGWPGVTHIEKRDFTPVIAAAKAADGFKATKPPKHILTGSVRDGWRDCDHCSGWHRGAAASASTTNPAATPPPPRHPAGLATTPCWAWRLPSSTPSSRAP